MNTRAKFLFACGALFMIALACNYPGFTDQSPQDNIEALENLAEQMDTPAVALTPGWLTDTPFAPQATATPAMFTAATLFLFPDQAVFSGVESVGSLYDFCIPPNIQPNDLGSGSFSIGEFGAILGQCKGVSPDETLHREGALTGAYSADERFVAFRLETVKIFSPHPDGRVMAVLTFEGNGPVVGNTATGVGNFDYSCAAEGMLVYCKDNLTSLQLNGTMPYQIEFIP